jgi:hypothetical protein
MPYCLAASRPAVHISQVSMIVEGSNSPIAQLPAAPANEVDQKVAQLIVDEIPNGACLQLGIGGMPNAVGSLIAQSDLKDLGVHNRDVRGRFCGYRRRRQDHRTPQVHRPGRQTFAFGAGTKKLMIISITTPR